MLLLNRKNKVHKFFDDLLFTFQYASIKPKLELKNLASIGKFTFQYASIKPETALVTSAGDFQFTF